jgi:hypothetical protein
MRFQNSEDVQIVLSFPESKSSVRVGSSHSFARGRPLPLYRQCQIFAHAGLTLSRTTLMQWVGATSELLGPLAAALAKHVLAAPDINADD